MRTALLLTVLLALPCLAAPVPKEAKNPPPKELTKGPWRIVFNGTAYDAMLLDQDEFCETAVGSESVWYGSWSWDQHKRTLKIIESPNCGVFTYHWNVVLDWELKGTTTSGLQVAFLPRPKK